MSGRLAQATETFRDAVRVVERTCGPIVDLFVRLALAQTFWISGVLKAADWDTAVRLATYEYPVSWLDPVTAAYVGAGIELICPVFLAVGLLTRLAALPLLALSLVIQTTYVALPQHLLWAVLFGFLAVRGAGALSLDRMLAPTIERTALPFASTVKAIFVRLSRYGADPYMLFLRAWLAAVFIAIGHDALAGAPSPLGDDLAQLGAVVFPNPALGPALAAALLAGGALLALGAATRWTALALIALAAAVAANGPPSEQYFYWMAALALIAAHGPGALSLDRLADSWLIRSAPHLAGLPPPWRDDAPHVVIVGAGFGGIAATRGLRHANARVTLIDRRNYHLFQPLLYQVATAALSPADIAMPIRVILRDQTNARVLLGSVTAIDADGRHVLIGKQRIPYDYLVLATGAQHSYFGRDDWAPLAPGLKKIDDAVDIRRRILIAFEKAEACDDPNMRQRLLTFVIVGAGPTGVELAGAIAELAKFGMEKDFRNFDPADARVILVQSGARILPAFADELSLAAQRALEALGVEVRLNSRVNQVDPAGVTIGDERIEAETILWAAGVTASPAAKWLGIPADRAGRVEVAADLSAPGLPNVFVIGDAAAAGDGNGGFVPGLAPAAQQAGAYVARLISARIAGRGDARPFRYRHLGSLATVGRKAAVADFKRLRISGSLAWWLWGAVHVAFLVGIRNRLSVLMDWFWAYLTYRHGTRLITADQADHD